MPRSRTRPRVAAATHNAVLDAAMRRVDEHLETRLADVVAPVLRRAGEEAAKAFRARVTDHLTASALRRADRDAIARSCAPADISSLLPPLVAAGAYGDVSPTTAMVCVKPRQDEAEAIADPGGAPQETLHVTLAFLGEVEDDALEPIRAALAEVAATHGPLSGVVGGYGEFRPPGVGILLPDVPGLVELRVALTEALVDAGIDYGRNHGFQAHITVDAAPEDGEIDEMLARATGAPLHFDSLLVVRGDATALEVPLVGVLPVTASALTAAGDPEEVAFRAAQLDKAIKELRTAVEDADPVGIAAARAELNDAKEKFGNAVGGVSPLWTAPAGDEVLDVQALAESIRAKTEPARKALVETTMTPSLAAAGLSFEVTNPLTAKALASTGAKIGGISDTTRSDVMQVIQSAWQSGLSIEHTAQMIDVTMQADAMSRARTIARTELVGAVNGGSLAATKLVQDATGDAYDKAWMTAPGAKYPRHELYEGLDGQTVGLDEKFDVGGAELDHPGDPDGDPAEVINCRCALRYVDRGGGSQTAQADEPTAPAEETAVEPAAGETAAVPEEAAPVESWSQLGPDADVAGEQAPLTDSEKEVVDWYSGADTNGSFETNSLLRGAGLDASRSRKVFADRTLGDVTQDLDSAVAKGVVTQNGFVYRGMSADTVEALTGSQDVTALEGKTFTDPGFISTTTDKAHADEFAAGEMSESGKPGVTLAIDVPEGTNALSVNDALGSATDSAAENEILLPRGTSLKIETVLPPDEDGTILAHASIVPAGEVAADATTVPSFSADIGVTPFRAGEDQAVGFYESDKYGQFVNDVHDSAASYGVTVDGLDRVTGVWQGDTEPSVSLRIHDGEKGVRAYAANLGNAYHQDGVLIFGDQAAGDVMATFQNPLPQGALTDAMAKAGIDGGRFTADGRLQVIGSGPEFVKQLDTLAEDIGPYDASVGRFELLERDSGDYGKAIQAFGPPNSKAVRNTFDEPKMWGEEPPPKT